MTGTLLSIGHGYSAEALARLLLPAGWRVIGTTRSAARAQALAASGVEPRVWPGDDLGPDIAAASHVLTSVAPGPTGDPVLEALEETLAAARHLEWVGYLSTTGVYGDHGGGWVDEDTPLTPATARGRARVAAEAAWRALGQRGGWPLVIFRLAGIYGPGRGPFEKVRNGTARRIIKEGQVFSRVHVEDIARALAASMARPQAGEVFNLCDDEPAPPQDIIACAAELLGMRPPPEIPFARADLSPMAASFYSESKRVDNRRMKEALGITPLYPGYRAGLAAVLEAETGGNDSLGRSPL